mmetsp:Transcript_9596/g.35562  ORF Transcript_9596/g.35562 Transcript_9596/m.35562 type:complete len:100 (+) Transcript_9596:1268-1567(+)
MSAEKRFETLDSNCSSIRCLLGIDQSLSGEYNERNFPLPTDTRKRIQLRIRKKLTRNDNENRQSQLQPGLIQGWYEDFFHTSCAQDYCPLHTTSMERSL